MVKTRMKSQNGIRFMPGVGNALLQVFPACDLSGISLINLLEDKVGCLCDPEVAAKALRTKGGSTALRKIFRIDADDAAEDNNTNAKRERCRMCIVYDYHQQQSTLISPIVLPFVIALIWTFYPKLATLITAAIQYTDQIMRYGAFA